MKQTLSIALLIAASLAATPLFAQAPSSQQNPSSQKTPPPSTANPFPEDENSVPVLPSKNTFDIPSYTPDSIHAAPAIDRDPVRSPDDVSADASQQSGFSSSLTGADNLAPPPDDDMLGKHKKKQDEEPEHQETAKEDLSVGQYYLDSKNWKAAQSRFQSALVLDPENPDVFWGLAESARHLGDFSNARAYYQKVAEYDPDSRHGKEATKALKEPDLANAKPVAMH